MKTKLITILLAGMSIVACDELNNGNNGNNPNALKPEDSRARLEQIGQQAIALANPEKQADLIKVINELVNLLESDEPLVPEQTAELVKGLILPMKAIADNNVRAAAEYPEEYRSTLIELDTYFGIHTYDSNGWNHEKSDSRLELKFPVEGVNVVMSVTCSEDVYENVFRDTYLDENEEGTTEVTEETFVNIPKRINASIIWGDKTLAELTIAGEYQVGEPLKTNIDLRMGTYSLDFDVDINTSSISQKTVFTIDGKTLLNSSFTVKGQFDMDPYYYINGPQEEIKNTTDFIKVKSISVNEQILDFSLSFGCSDLHAFETEYKALMEDADKKYYDFNGNGRPYPYTESYAKRVCLFINSKFTNEAAIDGSAFAKVTLVPYYDEFYDGSYWGNGDEEIEFTGRYEPMPVLEFYNDGAKFAFEEFFTAEGFHDLLTDWNELVDLYGNLM